MDALESLYSDYYDLVIGVRNILESSQMSNETKLTKINNLVKNIKLESGM